MNISNAGALVMRVAIEKFPLKKPFSITGYTMVDTDVVTVELEKDGHIGRGEASGVYYRKFDYAPSNLIRSMPYAVGSSSASIAIPCSVCCPLAAHAMRSTAPYAI